MTQLYRITEKHYDPNGEEEADVYVGIKDEPSEEIDGELYTLRCEPVDLDMLSIDDLVTAVESALEDANRTALVNVPGWIATHLKFFLDLPDANRVFRNMVEDKGLLWEI